MRGFFGHEPGQGPFGHHGSFGHHGADQHPFGHNGHNQRGPFGDRTCGYQEVGSGDYGFFARLQRPGLFHGVGHNEGFGPIRGPFSNETEQCGRDCCHNGRERRCRPCRPHSPDRRHGPPFGRRDRGDRCGHRGPHSPDSDDEERCCRHRECGRSRGPHGRGPNRRCHAPPHFGPPGFGPPGHFGHFSPHGPPHRGPFGPFGLWKRPEPQTRPNDCKCNCSKEAHSEQESGNETEGRCGRKNKNNYSKNKDDNRETVLIQRIVVEKEPRCYSI